MLLYIKKYKAFIQLFLSQIPFVIDKSLKKKRLRYKGLIYNYF